MKISYYPGCTLKTKAKNLDRAAVASLEALGVEVEEIERWNCCDAMEKGKGIITPTGRVGLWLDSPMIEELHGVGSVKKNEIRFCWFFQEIIIPMQLEMAVEKPAEMC